ncbi:hypothetical protein HKX48_004396 [Thoreauomyces humboldtii]|nr:hypothetical protein HKX48_004396 [Thoreauomyces humboldtii]
MNVIKEIQRLNAGELFRNTKESASWHAQYNESAYVYIGGIPHQLTEGDLIAVFSQYGEVVDINLVRDKQTGKSKGFCFVAYEDQRSTVLAVDNFNGTKMLGRTLRVDHVAKYRGEKRDEDFDEEAELKRKMKILPPHLRPAGWKDDDAPEEGGSGASSDEDDDEMKRILALDEEDPMRAYLLKKAVKKKAKGKKKAAKKEKKRDKDGKKVKKEKGAPVDEDDRRKEGRGFRGTITADALNLLRTSNENRAGFRGTITADALNLLPTEQVGQNFGMDHALEGDPTGIGITIRDHLRIVARTGRRADTWNVIVGKRGPSGTTEEVTTEGVGVVLHHENGIGIGIGIVGAELTITGDGYVLLKT